MSQLEDNLVWELKALKFPLPVRELRFAPPRRWRFDLSWPDKMVAAEIMGSIWTQGRHTRGAGFRNDCEKLNAAQGLGWKVFYFVREHIKSGYARGVLEEALKLNPK